MNRQFYESIDLDRDAVLRKTADIPMPKATIASFQKNPSQPLRFGSCWAI